MNYFKLLTTIQKGDKSFFEVSVEEQQLYLKSLGDPQDDIDRSFKQYLCQNYFVPQWKVLLLDLSFLLVPLFLLIIYILKGLFVKRQRHLEAIASFKLERGFFSSSVLKEFDVDDSHWREGQSLQFNDLSFCFKVLSKWLKSPFFVSKNVVSIAGYSNMIYKYSPKALLSHCEFSCTSSILTAYCNYKGVEHINTMHGEKLFYIRDSFFRFDRCYVWDEHYRNLFISMKAEPTQFRIFTPDSLKFDCDKYIREECYADFKYVLAVYSEEELSTVFEIFNKIEAKGYSYKLRPHPRYSDMSILTKYVDEKHIEYPQDVSIQESIANCNFVVGSYTTALSQAYCSGKKVVLDDIAFKDQYEKLNSMKYIMTSKDTLKLSELL